MPRIVLDTNIYISAFHFRGSLPRKILLAGTLGEFQQIISKELLAEIRGVLKIKFQYAVSKLDAIESLLLEEGELVDPRLRISAVEEDPDDNIILECAWEGKADCIVSGDKHLLKLKSYKKIPILSPRQFVEIYLPILSQKPKLFQK